MFNPPRGSAKYSTTPPFKHRSNNHIMVCRMQKKNQRGQTAPLIDHYYGMIIRSTRWCGSAPWSDPSYLGYD